MHRLVTIKRYDLRLLLLNLQSSDSGYTRMESHILHDFKNLVYKALGPYHEALAEIDDETTTKAKSLKKDPKLTQDMKEAQLNKLAVLRDERIDELNETLGQEVISVKFPKPIYEFVYGKWTAEEEEIYLPNGQAVVRKRKYHGQDAINDNIVAIDDALEMAVPGKDDDDGS